MSVGFNRRKRFAQVTWALFATACASAPASAPQTSVRLEPPRTAAAPVQTSAPAPTAAALPTLPAPAGTISDGGPRIQSLDANGQELSSVVRLLAVTFGLQYHIDPGVRGQVNARLRNATLQEALRQILPQGVTYELQDRTLRVGVARVETRIFTLDYVALSRVGTASTVIQRRLGSSLGSGGGGNVGAAQAGLGGGAGGALGGGADVISAVSVADVWEDIRVAVEALVFESTAGGSAPQAALSSGTGSMGSGGRPYSRTTPDGRRLIVNAIAGTITVTAYPSELAQVENFIRTFEASIQRQVLIEAKIVEVNLDQTFEFGIDWNVVSRAGTAGLNLKTPTSAPRSAGNVEFTLSGGPGQISAVLNALETQGTVRVLSSPRVSALNNQRAVFNVTTSEVIFTTSRVPVGTVPGTTTPVFETQVTPTQVAVGIVLDVLPQISANNGVTMNIRPVVTSVRGTAQFTQDGNTFSAPIIDTRESDTMARLRAGETIIIGGLMQTRSDRQKSGIPGLRSIPLLGRLFTSYKNVERKSELVIFLTPTIIAGQPPASP
jgi:MSHA biogenesis protein MshL